MNDRVDEEKKIMSVTICTGVRHRNRHWQRDTRGQQRENLDDKTRLAAAALLSVTSRVTKMNLIREVCAYINL